MDLWIVLIEDRHASVEPVPFSREEAALTCARELAAEYSDGEAQEEPLTPGMVESGWVLLIPYGTENNCIRVVRRVLDTPRPPGTW